MLRKHVSNWSRDDGGATMVEYGIAVLVGVIVGTAGLILMGQQIGNNMNTAATELADRSTD
ncbi:MAG: Flp family type IVb pilin [Pseudomonadota bacterium]